MNVVSLKMETPSEQEDEQPTFDDFWLMYPRKVAKKAARKEWDRLTPTQQMDALVALLDWRKVFANRDEEKVPHGSTWLHGERWEDELPKEFRRPVETTKANAEFRAKNEDAFKNRRPMPDALRAFLKLNK